MDRTLGSILVAVAAVLLVLLVAAPLAMMAGMMGAPMMGFPFGMLLMLIVPVLLVVLIALLGLRLLGRGGLSASPPRPESLEILDRRYASGEIGREEYDRIRVDLERR